jgi:hypothetical protein
MSLAMRFVVCWTATNARQWGFTNNEIAETDHAMES